MIFDPDVVSKFADCGIHLLDTPDELVPAALNYIGEDPDSHDPDVIAKAEDVLMAIRPYVQKFHSSEYINALANGDRSEEHTSEIQSLMRISYAVFCVTKNTQTTTQ